MTSFSQIDLQSTFELRRMLLQAPTEAVGFVDEISFDYSLDGDVWQRYYEDADAYSGEVSSRK